MYTGNAWSVWLITREGAWGWLSDSFTQYFRMALVHLGLPGWQAAFANLPLIPWAEVRTFFSLLFCLRALFCVSLIFVETSESIWKWKVYIYILIITGSTVEIPVNR